MSAFLAPSRAWGQVEWGGPQPEREGLAHRWGTGHADTSFLIWRGLEPGLDLSPLPARPGCHMAWDQPLCPVGMVTPWACPPAD